jgi:hypothetical protein
MGPVVNRGSGLCDRPRRDCSTAPDYLRAPMMWASSPECPYFGAGRSWCDEASSSMARGSDDTEVIFNSERQSRNKLSGHCARTSDSESLNGG